MTSTPVDSMGATKRELFLWMLKFAVQVEREHIEETRPGISHDEMAAIVGRKREFWIAEYDSAPDQPPTSNPAQQIEVDA